MSLAVASASPGTQRPVKLLFLALLYGGTPVAINRVKGLNPKP